MAGDRLLGVQAWLVERLGAREPSPGTAKVLRAVSTRPRELAYASTADAAASAEVNVATVVRAAQAVGFSGWPALRGEVRSRYLAGLSAAEMLGVRAGRRGSPWEEALRADLRNLQEAAQTLDAAQVERVARAIHDARRTVVLGSGSFGAPALQLSHVAETIGLDVRWQRTGGTALLNTVKQLGPDDVVVLFSLWRSPRELMNASAVATAQGARLVVVADRADREVLALCDELVIVPSDGVSMFVSVTAGVTLVNGVLAALVAIDPDRARASYGQAERLWTDLGLFPPASPDVDGEVGHGAGTDEGTIG